MLTFSWDPPCCENRLVPSLQPGSLWLPSPSVPQGSRSTRGLCAEARLCCSGAAVSPPGKHAFIFRGVGPARILAGRGAHMPGPGWSHPCLSGEPLASAGSSSSHSWELLHLPDCGVLSPCLQSAQCSEAATTLISGLRLATCSPARHLPVDCPADRAAQKRETAGQEHTSSPRDGR